MIRRREIKEILGSNGAMTFEEIYDALWEEPNPIDLQDKLTSMVEEGVLKKDKNDDDVTIYSV